MTTAQAEMLIWFGGLGLTEFGGLLLAVRYVDRSAVGRGWRAAVLTPSNRRRVERGLSLAPALLVLSAAAVIAGAVLRWTVAS